MTYPALQRSSSALEYVPLTVEHSIEATSATVFGESTSSRNIFPRIFAFLPNTWLNVSSKSRNRIRPKLAIAAFT